MLYERTPSFVLFALMLLLHVRGAAGSLSYYCGGDPKITDSNVVQWSNTMYVNHSYVEVRKANDISTQTGCLNSEKVTSFRAFPDDSPSYTFPAMDYDSLYIAKVIWLSNSYTAYYRNNSECYFIPQRREYSHMHAFVKHTAGLLHA